MEPSSRHLKTGGKGLDWKALVMQMEVCRITDMQYQAMLSQSMGECVRVLPEFPLFIPFIVLLPLSISALAY